MPQRCVQGMPRQGSACALALVCLAWLSVASAQEPRYAFNFIQADLNPVIQVMADFTDKRFIIDSRVFSNVTLEMAEPQTPDEVLETLKSLLEKQGFALVQAGNDLKVLPGPSVTGSDGPDDAEPDRVISRQTIFPPAPRRLDRNEFRARQSPLRDPPDFSEEISLQPVRAGGVQRGYRVYPRGDATEFTRLGFDPGDLVLSINDLPLNDAARGEQLFNEAIRAESVTVRLERAGRTEHLLLASGIRY